MANFAARTTDQLTTTMRHQLDRIQRQTALITGFLSQTRLALEPEPPQGPGKVGQHFMIVCRGGWIYVRGSAGRRRCLWPVPGARW
jgi:hypothetical protein